MSLTDAEKTAQREAVARLIRCAVFGLDSFVIDNIDAIERMTPAVRARLVAAAAIGYLIGNGLVTEVDPDAERWLPVVLPEHLKPDVAEALASSARWRSALRP